VSSVDPASVLRSAFVPAVIVALISLAILIRRPTARAALILLFALGAAVSTPSTGLRPRPRSGSIVWDCDHGSVRERIGTNRGERFEDRNDGER
jgi:hypothetical protein